MRTSCVQFRRWSRCQRYSASRRAGRAASRVWTGWARLRHLRETTCTRTRAMACAPPPTLRKTRSAPPQTRRRRGPSNSFVHSRRQDLARRPTTCYQHSASTLRSPLPIFLHKWYEEYTGACEYSYEYSISEATFAQMAANNVFFIYVCISHRVLFFRVSPLHHRWCARATSTLAIPSVRSHALLIPMFLFSSFVSAL